jgi:alpha-D-xyloside xylohydrolase
MQVGDASSQPPWVFTAENGRDDAALDVYRTYARLHLRLFPYAWTYATRMREDGRPIQRPLGLAHPELGVHPADEYLFGDELLVAPVIARGATRRHVILPGGQWRSFWDASIVEGPEADVDAPLETLPLFVREGAIVPLLRPAIDTLAPATLPGIESFANDAGALWALIVPGPPRRFETWDGAAIEREPGGAIAVSPGRVFDRGFVLELVATERPSGVEGDGVAWTWTPDRRGTLRIELPARAQRVRIVH